VPGFDSPQCDVGSAVAWLVDGARSAPKPDDVLTQLCERLLEGGVPLFRAAVFVWTLHPDLLGRRYIWRLGEGTSVTATPHENAQTEEFRQSPVIRVYETCSPLRRRLADPDCPRDFAVLEDFRAEGLTDYYVAPLLFSNGEIHVATFSTRQEGGFTDTQLAAIKQVIAPLSRVAEVRALRRVATNLLDAYVGHQSGERILAGRIKRGDTEAIRAAIWLSDMRGFTARADSMAPHALIALLNRFFDCQVPAILEHGGEVLKFMGDGLLAIFRMGEGSDQRAICTQALSAARNARAKILELSVADDQRHEEKLRFGLALHVGEALYGNIGGGGRLDFTCIGPAVNLAARLEKLASKLNRMILASSAFAQFLPGEFAPLGDFSLQGFRATETAYGLRDE
jgi:adenylate cyclase